MLMSTTVGNILKRCSREVLCLVFVEAQLKAQSIMNFIPVTRCDILIFFFFFFENKKQKLYLKHIDIVNFN